MTELKKYKLGDLLDVKRGASLSGEYYATEGQYVRLTCGNFDYNQNCFKENTSKDNIFYIGQVRPEFIMNKGDIITPLTEQAIGLLGSTAIIPESGKYIQSQDVAKIICKEGKLYPAFAFYLVSSAMVKYQLSAGAQQTKIRHTSPDKIKACSVWIPDYENQKRIASVLSAIDDKIALNRRINKQLEQTARDLYDYWFLQFDFPDANGNPYRASGGAMTYNATLKREIPVGWEVKRLDNFVELFTGKKDVSKIIPGPYKFFSCAPLPIPSSTYISDGPLIMVSGNGSYTGRVLYYNGKCDLYQRTYGCRMKKGYESFLPFIYYSLLLQFQPIFTGGKHGSAIPYIVLNDLAGFSMIINEDVVSRFCAVIKDSFALSNEYCMEEISRLMSLRDQLLPLLMNGQATIIE